MAYQAAREAEEAEARLTAKGPFGITLSDGDVGNLQADAWESGYAAASADVVTGELDRTLNPYPATAEHRLAKEQLRIAHNQLRAAEQRERDYEHPAAPEGRTGPTRAPGRDGQGGRREGSRRDRPGQRRPTA